MDRLPPSPRRPVGGALAWAAGWGLLLVAVYWSAVRTSWGQRLDEDLLEHLYDDDPVVYQTASHVVRPGVPLLLGAVVVWLCVVAWRAGRRRTVGVVGSVVLVTAVLSPVLRDVVLTRPDLGFGVDNSMPSTHMALSTALAGAVVALRRGHRADPHRTDGAVAVGAVDGAGADDARSAGSGADGARAGRAWVGWTTGVVLAALLVVEAVANVMAYAHRPADTVAGFALAAALWSLASGIEGALGRRARRPVRRARAHPPSR